MLRNCPQHGLNNFNKVQIFYKGVNVPTRKEIDIAAGGSLMKKTLDEAYEIISETATHSYDWHQEMDVSHSSDVASTETSDELASVKAQLVNFKRQMDSMTKEMHAIKIGCELCQGPHLRKDCDQASMEEHANYLDYVKKGDFALSEFPGGRQFFNQAGNTSGNNYQSGNQVYQGNQKINLYRPPGFNNRNQQAPPINFQQTMQPVQQPENKMPPLEELLRGFIMKMDESITALRQDGESTKQKVRSQQASIQNLEHDVGRIAQSLSERPPGTLPSNTQSNTNNKVPFRNDHVNAITTRSGLVINEETLKSPIPYPKALKKDKLANQYKKFLDMINQISINMPLAEVIKGMPNYEKFLKDLIS
ncbi:uncharacterized protein [Rutidosis leptorrhynchoides]|uniref:uncharacterized protein n=1 Tax=Rutidosis leptorrhynchoides TaxID=125765 RepID=UPI003A99BC47